MVDGMPSVCSTQGLPRMALKVGMISMITSDHDCGPKHQLKVYGSTRSTLRIVVCRYMKGCFLQLPLADSKLLKSGDGTHIYGCPRIKQGRIYSHPIQEYC